MWIRSIAISVMLVVLARVAPLHAQPTRASRELPPLPGEDEKLYSCKNGKGPVTITFKPESELKDLLTWVMSFTCKNFVLDPRIVSTGKKISLVVPKTLTPSEAYQVFLVALSTVGLTVVPKGRINKVVESSTARAQTIPLVLNGSPGNGEQFVRYVFRPTYAQAEMIRQAFSSLKSDAGDVQAFGSIVVIADYASHVRDMMSLAKMIDVANGSDGVYTIPVVHADATKLAPKLESFLGVNATHANPASPAAHAPGAASAAKLPSAPASGAEIASAVPSKIMVDDRTNTLVLAASEAAFRRVKAIVARLDIPLEIEGGATFHVYPLGHAIAEELAQTLTQAIQGGGSTAASAANGKPGAANAAAAAATKPAAAPTAELGSTLEGPVRVISEKATNSLIVMSSGRDFLAIREVIRQLDQPRRQVFIEAVILEVGVEKGLTIGASSHGGVPFGGGNSLVLGGVQTGTLSSLDVRTLAASTGLLGGLVGKTLANSKAILGTSIPSYAVLFSALGSSDNSNVLSAPSIIALDNEEAKYKVGTNIPYQKGTSYGGIGTGTDLPIGAVGMNIDRMDLLLELSIKPHISANDTLLLEIKHDAKDVIGQPGTLGPTWSTRSFETRVVVRDQQSVVIGGLMQEREQVTKSKVPVLGDIPLLGYFFKHEQKSKRKTNLVILLTPYIVKDQLDLEEIRERKMRDHEEFVQSFSTLSAMKYMPKIDYRRKRGLIEEIHRTVVDIEADVEARKALRAPPSVESGPIDYTAPTDAAFPAMPATPAAPTAPAAPATRR